MAPLSGTGGPGPISNAKPEGQGLRVACLVRSWPRLSQTFVLNEVLALQRAGVELDVFSMVPAGEALVQPQAAAVTKPVRYLDDAAARPTRARAAEHLAVARRCPARYLSSLVVALARRGLAAGYANSSTWACFASAVHLADTFAVERHKGRPVNHLHAHFAHDPTLVAYFVHRLSGLTYSFTAHARDLYGVPAGALLARSLRARSIVTCCHANARYLRQVLPDRLHGRLHVIHHGVDLEAFRPPVAPPHNDRPRIVSVGRLVEKKGFADLLAACARLKAEGRPFSCVIFGEGPLLDELEAQRDQLGLADEVTFGGARVQAELIDELRGADVFALTPFVTDDGDRDGVPNVLVEAMACGLPVVTTSAGGITDLVAHGENGLLADPHDIDAITAHLTLLLEDAEHRRLLAARARRTVEERFDIADAARRLTELFAGNGDAHG